MISKIFKTAVFLIAAVTLVSCDKDFNEIGTDLIGDDHYSFDKIDDLSISAGSLLTGPVQTNGLALTPFGIYNDPTFGKTTANFVTTLELASVNPTLDDFIDVDSVRLYVPYFSHVVRTAAGGRRIYELDSILGDSTTTFKLKISQNNYFLRDQDVSGEQAQDQAYYNDMRSGIEGLASPQALNYRTTFPIENSAFRFTAKEVVTYKHNTVLTETDTSVVRQAPGMSLRLDKTFFKTRVLQAPDAALSSNSAFKNHFRGLYFNLSDQSTARGVLNMMDFSKGSVTIYYRRNITSTSNGVTSTSPRRFEMKLNLTGNSVGLYDYDTPPSIPGGRLLVKGGQGAISFVDILTAEERAQMISDSLMINEANLIFNVDENAMQPKTKKPMRLYLYDMTHGQPISDYNFDGSTAGDPKRGKAVYGGLLDSIRDTQTNQWKYSYKFRITRYVRDLIQKPDSTDVRLGLSVSESVLENTMANLKTPISITDPNCTATYKKLPKASVPHPFGVILHGPDSDVVEERLKLVIYYTKPENETGN